MSAARGVAWAQVIAVVFGGVAAALQVGKASVTLPALIAEFDLSVVLAAAWLSCISLCAALGGVAFGWIGTRFGVRRIGTLGLALMGGAALAGAFAGSFGALMAARLAEALAMLMIVTTLPAVLREATLPEREALPFGLWAAWMPIGLAIGMLVGRYGLPGLGWRGVHVICAAVPLIGVALMLAFVVNRPALRPAPAARPAGAPHWPPEVLHMAACFCAYSVVYMTFAAFVPTVAAESLGLAPGPAAALAFWAAVLIIPGNLGLPPLVRRGFGRQGILALSLAAMLLAAAGFFWEGAPLWLRIGSALAMAPTAGLAAAVLWSAIPLLADGTGMAAARVSGVFFQASATGQFLGPIAAGAMVRLGGDWTGAVLVTGLAGLAGIGLSLWRLPDRRR